MAGPVRTVFVMLALSLPMAVESLRLKNDVGRSSPSLSGAEQKSLVQVAAKAIEAASDLAISGPPSVDIANIRRYGYKSWYIVKDGHGVQENMESKSVSAKPSGIIWDRIGTWNYTLSANKTNPLIRVKLDGSVGTLVKIDLALGFIFGGSVQKWTAHPELWKKGRFLRKLRVIPMTYCSNSYHGGYSANARVSEVTVRRNGTRGDPVAEATLKIKIEYGQKRLSRAFWYKSEWEITVQGTGHYVARKLSSKGPFGDPKAWSLMKTESVSTDSEEESVEEFGEQEGHESEDQMDDEDSMESEGSSAEDEPEEQMDDEAESLMQVDKPQTRIRKLRDADDCKPAFAQCSRSEECCSQHCFLIAGVCTSVR